MRVNILTDYRLLQRDYLLRIARAMTSRLDLHEVLTMVIRYAVEITNGRAGAIAMRQADGRFKVVAGYGLDERYLDSLTPFLERVPRLVLPGESQGWELPQFEQRLKQLAASMPDPFAQMVALPLAMHNHLTGILFVFRSEGAKVFTPLDSQLLAAFANQAAIAIQNANLYAEMAIQANELRRLYDFSVSILRAPDRRAALELAVEHAAIVGPSQWLAILCCAEKNNEQFVERVSGGAPPQPVDEDLFAGLEELSREILQHGRPLVFSDLTQDEQSPDVLRRAGFHSAVAVPIRGPARPLGLLWAASVNPDQYEEKNVRVLMTFAQYLGLALDKFNLFEQLAARERQLAAIVEHNPAGMLLLDARGRVIAQNPVLAALTGNAGDLRSGVEVATLLRLENEAGQPLVFSLPNGDTPVTVQGYLLREDGTRGPYVQVTVTPLFDEAPSRRHTVEGYVATIVDLTAYRENEAAKNAFLAGLSHELKTPLALIRGYAETLRYPQVREDEKLYHDSLDVILTETDHLTEMVNQLLLAARLQARALTLDLDEIALGPMLQKLVDEFRQAYPTHRWQIEVAEDLPTIVADPTRLREVFQNLLSNAVQYSDPDTLIRVTAESTSNGVRVSVTDEGIGISSKDQQRLFQRFFRASDRADGTGLGLYMSKAIVEAHGGTIRVDSELGCGSTFTVELPRTQPQRES